MSVTDMILDLAIRYGFQVLGALVILGVGVLVARLSGRLADQWLQGQKIEPPVRLLMVRSIRAVVLLFALVVALDKFGFQIAPLVAGIGAVGLGITFALQGVLSNMMAGLTIIFTKPFRVGEYIALLGVHGAVASIELFSTTLTHADRSQVVIPNRKIVGEILHNYGTMRQLHLMISVPHTADLARVLALAREVVTRSTRVLRDPGPVVGVEQVGDSGIRIGLHPWVQVVDMVPAEAEIYRDLVEEFRTQGIGVGLPQREVFLLSGASPATGMGGRP